MSVQFFTKSKRFVVLLGEGGSPADKSYVLIQNYRAPQIPANIHYLHSLPCTSNKLHSVQVLVCVFCRCTNYFTETLLFLPMHHKAHPTQLQALERYVLLTLNIRL